MLNKVLSTIAEELNHFLKSRLRIDKDLVRLGFPNNPNLNECNQLVLAMTNIEKSALFKSPATQADKNQMRGGMDFNVQIIVSADTSAEHYGEGLDWLSGAIGYFESKPVFTSENTPGLPSNIHKVTVEMEHLPSADLNAIFQMLGVNYRPTAAYQLRLLSFAEDTIMDSEIAEVTTASSVK